MPLRPGRLLDRYRPSGLYVALDDREAGLRASLIVGITALIPVTVFIVVFFAVGETPSGVISIVSGVTLSTAFVVFLFTGSSEQIARTYIYSGLIIVPINHIFLGGYVASGGWMLWGIPNAIAAAIWLERRDAATVAGLFLSIAVVMAFFEDPIRGLRDRPDDIVMLLNVVGVCVFTIAMTVPTILFMVGRLRYEHQRSRDLMLNILPESIADRMLHTDEPIADSFEEATILFTDLVGFTGYSTTVVPEVVVAQLNVMFSRFDEAIARRSGQKIKTTGDGYMITMGVPEPVPDHVDAACYLALDLHEELSAVNHELGTSFQMRIGIATGPIVAAVIGADQISYDAWSDSVNLASRLESVTEPGTTLVSAEVRAAAGDGFAFRSAGTFELKGLDQVEAYHLVVR